VNLDAASYRPAHARPSATSGNQAQPLHGGCIAEAGPKRSEPQWIAFAGLHPCPKPKIGPTEEMLLPTWVGRRSQGEEHKASMQVCSAAAAMCTSQERCPAGHLNTAIGNPDCTKIGAQQVAWGKYARRPDQQSQSYPTFGEQNHRDHVSSPMTTLVFG